MSRPDSSLSNDAAAQSQFTVKGQDMPSYLAPKALPHQIRAVRSALGTLSDPTDATVIAKLFKGARKDRIEAILESLQALGHAHEEEDGRYSV